MQFSWCLFLFRSLKSLYRYSVIVISNHKVTPHPALFKGIKQPSLNPLGVLVCQPSVMLRCMVGCEGFGRGSLGSMRRVFGTLLWSNRESALFSDLNFLTWNCRGKKRSEWMGHSNMSSLSTASYSPVRPWHHPTVKQHFLSISPSERREVGNIMWHICSQFNTRKIMIHLPIIQETKHPRRVV